MRPSRTRGRAVLVPFCLVLGAAACETSSYRETGDLAALRHRGQLRILVPSLGLSMLPRRGYPADMERELAEDLATSLHLEPVVVEVSEREALFQDLLEGRGDVALARLTITPDREKHFAFSTPLDEAREMLVVRKGGRVPHKPEELAGMRVAVRRSSSFHETLVALRRRVPGLAIVDVPEDWDTEEILARVAAGEYQASVADDDLLDAVLTYRDDLVAAFPLTGPQPIAWAMRPDSRELKTAVDHFLHERALIGDLEPVLFGDVPAIRRRRVLRVLTRNNAVTTYLYRGEQVGFEFELARAFARTLGCRVEIVIPPNFSDLIPWLLEGRGDLIAASLAVTESRARRVAFTHPYLQVPQVLVVRAGSRIRRPADLVGRRVVVRPSSVYHETLEGLVHAGLALRIEDAPESVETEELIGGVADGDYDATLALQHIVTVERSVRNDVRPAFELGAPVPVAWAVRPNDPELLAAANGFLADSGPGSAFFNLLERRYFSDSPAVERRILARPRISGHLSPYDPLFRKYGERFGIDWRLLVAQSFQESRFAPDARSLAGAQGLMQLLPVTAQAFGVHGDLEDPETAIHAGALYLRHLADRYYADLPLSERLRFALAAYNVGPGHVLDGQRLARDRGLDPDAWFGNVEKVLPLLERQAYASRARSGYCRCWQAVRYVRDVQARYRRYAKVVE